MLGLSVGLSEQEIAAMGAPDQCDSFDAVDKLVLRYSEAVTKDNRVDDALYAELEAQFDRTELMELAATVGLAAMVNRMHATFRTDLDQDTQALVGDAQACSIIGR